MIVKDITSANFMMFDRDVYKNLSKNGRSAYMAYAYEHTNSQATNTRMSELSEIGMSDFKKAKAELIEKGYLYTKRTGGKGSNIIYYFGEKAVKKELDK